MKHIKIYEKYISKKNPHVGDYVLVNVDYVDLKHVQDNLGKFLNNNIGKIISFQIDEKNAVVEYENIPLGLLYIFDSYDLEKNTISVFVKDIICFSKRKKDIDVEALSTAKKYNL